MARKNTVTVHHYHRKSYTLWNFFVDAFLTFLTGGLWLIWIFIREMRRR